jgi:hypothetical protein
MDCGTVAGRVLLERKIVHVPDVLDDPAYTNVRECKPLGEIGSLTATPHLRIEPQRPRSCYAAEQRDELATLQLTELHPMPPNHGATG